MEHKPPHITQGLIILHSSQPRISCVDIAAPNVADDVFLTPVVKMSQVFSRWGWLLSGL